MTKLLPEEQITKQAYDKYGYVWAKKYGIDPFNTEMYQKYNKLLPRGRVIEIGSGLGKDAEGLIKLGYEYIGVDISETLIKIAKKREPSATFYKRSVYNLPFKEKFDGFWCTATLLHVPKARINEALQSIKSVVKSGAIGYITIKGGEGSEVEEYEIEKGVTLKRFYQYWTKDEFTRTLATNGFKVVYYDFVPANERQKWHRFLVKLDKD